jgi:hypothetical protein
LPAEPSAAIMEDEPVPSYLDDDSLPDVPLGYESVPSYLDDDSLPDVPFGAAIPCRSAESAKIHLYFTEEAKLQQKLEEEEARLEGRLDKLRDNPTLTLTGGNSLQEVIESLKARINVARGGIPATSIPATTSPSNSTLNSIIKDAVSIVTKAIQCDHDQQYKVAHALYVKALDYFCVGLTNTPGLVSQEIILKRCYGYADRMEQLAQLVDTEKMMSTCMSGPTTNAQLVCLDMQEKIDALEELKNNGADIFSVLALLNAQKRKDQSRGW